MENPEFETVLACQTVKAGEDVVLCCRANTEVKSATWMKNDCVLNCIYGKHSVKQERKLFSLEIKNAEEEDEGIYSLTLKNNQGSTSCYAHITVELREWRTLLWEEAPLVSSLKAFKISGSVKELRFLLYGPLGAGRSSVINTIKSIFLQRQFIGCLTAELSSPSLPLSYQKFSVGVRDSGLFSFFEVGGLETGDHGTHPDDVIQALKGHISIGYQFRPGCPINEDNPYYISSQGLRDQIHCAVIVVSAEKLPYLTCGDKLKTIRTAASRLGIPQLVFMTNVDMVCGLTCKDLSKIYQSRRIKNRMKECSNLLGVPLNCIFPVKNYHQETCMDEKINCLMLDALTQIVHSANDYVEKCSRNQTHSE